MNNRKYNNDYITPSFKPYLISIPNYKKIKSIHELLQHVFSAEEITNDTANTDIPFLHQEVNETFLLQLAYGIQSIDSYDPGITPGEVMFTLQELMYNYPLRNHACLYFLHHYLIVTELHGPKKIDIHSQRAIEWLTPRNSEYPSSFCLSKESESCPMLKKNNQIDAMVNDINLLHINNFMHLYNNFIQLGKPIPDNNTIVFSFNQLLNLISEDIAYFKENSKSLKIVLKMYLAVAKKLLAGPIKNLEGTAIIAYALERNMDLIEKTKDCEPLKNEIIKLCNTFSMTNNFNHLRNEMLSPNCIPLFMIINKDLTFCKENIFWDRIFLIGKQFHYLAQKHSELCIETKKLRLFHPTYQTNLCYFIQENNLNNTLYSSQNKELAPTGKPSILVRKQKRRSLSITPLTNTHSENNINSNTNPLINSTSTPSLSTNQSPKKMLRKQEAKKWNRNSLAIKLNDLKPETPEIKSERSLKRSETCRSQEHSHFFISKKDSRRFSDSSALTSNREKEENETQNTKIEYKIFKLS